MPSTTYYQKRPIMEAEFKAGFVVYDSSYPTDIEARRELKYCQGYCGRLFVAHYKVVTDDATGEKKISVDLVCTACASKLDSGQTKEFPLSVKEEKELLADHLPEGGERHPKSGFAAHVPEPRVNAAFVGQKGVRWSKWRITIG